MIAFDRPWLSLFGSAGETLEQLLPPWIDGRRWYAGRGIEVAGLRVLDQLQLGRSDDAVRMVLARLESEAGEQQALALPLSLVATDGGAAVRERTPAAVIAELRAPGEETIGATLVDALADGPSSMDFLAAIRSGARAHGTVGHLVAGTLPGAPPLDDPSLVACPSSPDHRRVAVHYGDSLVFKFDRFLGEGTSPELEIGRLLAARGRAAPVPPVHGFIEFRPPRGEPITLGTLLGFVRAEGSAWAFFYDELRRFHERAVAASRSGHLAVEHLLGSDRPLLELCGSAPPPALREVMGHAVSSAQLLGRRVGELHRALVDNDDPAFRPEPIPVLDQRAFYQARRNLTGRTVRMLRSHLPQLQGEAARLANILVGRWREILDRFEPLLTRRLTVLRTRVHGHLHLGNVLYTGKDFRIIDLDGDPARSLAERRRKRSPLFDIATLLRSLEACAYLALGDEACVRDADRPAAEPWTQQWARWVPAALVGGWLEMAREAPFFPRAEGELVFLLDLHRLEAALEEIERTLDGNSARAIVAMRAVEDLLEA